MSVTRHFAVPWLFCGMQEQLMLLSQMNYSRYVGMEELSKALIQSCYFEAVNNFRRVGMWSLKCSEFSALSPALPPTCLFLPSAALLSGRTKLVLLCSPTPKSRTACVCSAVQGLNLYLLHWVRFGGIPAVPVPLLVVFNGQSCLRIFSSESTYLISIYSAFSAQIKREGKKPCWNSKELSFNWFIGRATSRNCFCTKITPKAALKWVEDVASDWREWVSNPLRIAAFGSWCSSRGT